MSTYQKIEDARNTLELPESATMDEIRSSYRRLIRKWHPDKCREDREVCVEMTKKLIDAYGTLLSYCRNYRFSFAEEEVMKYLSGEEWWVRRFGDDPVWGSVKNGK